jgi:small subunit ribosomal protein S6
LLRDYEILYIVRPELDEEQLQAAIATVNQLIESLGGGTQKTDVWGRRRLAYEVRHLREGQYVLSDFQIDPARVPELEGTLKISDTVFRHLVVRKPEIKVRRKAKGKQAQQPEEPPAPQPVAAGAAEQEATAT